MFCLLQLLYYKERLDSFRWSSFSSNSQIKMVHCPKFIFQNQKITVKIHLHPVAKSSLLAQHDLIFLPYFLYDSISILTMMILLNFRVFPLCLEFLKPVPDFLQTHLSSFQQTTCPINRYYSSWTKSNIFYPHPIFKKCVLREVWGSRGAERVGERIPSRLLISAQSLMWGPSHEP